MVTIFRFDHMIGENHIRG